MYVSVFDLCNAHIFIFAQAFLEMFKPSQVYEGGSYFLSDT